MKTTPMGRMSSVKVFIAPVVGGGQRRLAQVGHHDGVGDADHHLGRPRDDDGPGQREERAEPGPWRRTRRGGRPRIIDGLPGRVSASQEATSMSSGTGGT